MKRILLIAMLLASPAFADDITITGDSNMPGLIITGTGVTSSGTLTNSLQRCPDSDYYGTPAGCADMKAKEVCHTVIDNTRVNAINCMAFSSTEYVCPKSGEPCYSFIITTPVNPPCGEVTKQVCGPPEMFHDEDPRFQTGNE